MSPILNRLARLLSHGMGGVRRRWRRLRQAPSRVLLLKSTSDHLGDLILITGVLPRIRKAFPDARIELAANEEGTDLFLDHPDIDAFIPLPCLYSQRTIHSLPLWRNAGRFDTIICLRRNPGPKLIPLLQSFGPARRIGLVGDEIHLTPSQTLQWRKLLDTGIEVPDRSPPLHELDVHAHLLSHLTGQTVTPGDIRPRLSHLPTRPNPLDRWLSQRHPDFPTLLISPGGTDPLRRWEASAYQHLFRNLPPCNLVFTGTAAESSFIADCWPATRTQHHSINLSGQTRVGDLIHLLKQADAVLSIDGGMMHLSLTLGRPTVSLCAGGQWNRFVPWSLETDSRFLTHRTDCFGCNWQCRHDQPICIRSIPSDRVLEALREMVPILRTPPESGT